MLLELSSHNDNDLGSQDMPVLFLQANSPLIRRYGGTTVTSHNVIWSTVLIYVTGLFCYFTQRIEKHIQIPLFLLYSSIFEANGL